MDNTNMKKFVIHSVTQDSMLITSRECVYLNVLMILIHMQTL